MTHDFLKSSLESLGFRVRHFCPAFAANPVLHPVSTPCTTGVSGLVVGLERLLFLNLPMFYLHGWHKPALFQHAALHAWLNVCCKPDFAV